MPGDTAWDGTAATQAVLTQWLALLASLRPSLEGEARALAHACIVAPGAGADAGLVRELNVLVRIAQETTVHLCMAYLDEALRGMQRRVDEHLHELAIAALERGAGETPTPQTGFEQ